MSQMNTNGRTGRGLLEQGGITGALVGGLLGGSEGAAKGYATVANLRGLEQGMRLTEDQGQRAEETHDMDLATKYMDLQLKSREIQIEDMKIEVATEAQSGKLSDAKLASKLATDMLGEYTSLSKTQSNQVALGAIKAVRDLDDQKRSIVATLGEGVNDAQSHAQAYNTLSMYAESLGVKVEDIAPGMTKEYDPVQTPRAYRFAKHVATASQKVLEGERLEAGKNRNEMTKLEKLQAYDLERMQKKFEYDVHIQTMSNKAALESSRIKALASSGVELKRNDFDNLPTSEAANIAHYSIKPVIDSLDGFGSPDEDQLKSWSNNIATSAQAGFDKAYSDYANSNYNPAYTPKSIHLFLEEAIGKFVGRMDSSGNLDSDDLAEDREKHMREWVLKAKTDPKSPYKGYNDNELTTLAAASWEDPQVRMR